MRLDLQHNFIPPSVSRETASPRSEAAQPARSANNDDGTDQRAAGVPPYAMTCGSSKPAPPSHTPDMAASPARLTLEAASALAKAAAASASVALAAAVSSEAKALVDAPAQLHPPASPPSEELARRHEAVQQLRKQLKEASKGLAAASTADLEPSDSGRGARSERGGDFIGRLPPPIAQLTDDPKNGADDPKNGTDDPNRGELSGTQPPPVAQGVVSERATAGGGSSAEVSIAARWGGAATQAEPAAVHLAAASSTLDECSPDEVYRSRSPLAAPLPDSGCTSHSSASTIHVRIAPGRRTGPAARSARVGKLATSRSQPPVSTAHIPPILAFVFSAWYCSEYSSGMRPLVPSLLRPRSHAYSLTPRPTRSQDTSLLCRCRRLTRPSAFMPISVVAHTRNVGAAMPLFRFALQMRPSRDEAATSASQWSSRPTAAVWWLASASYPMNRHTRAQTRSHAHART